MVGIVGVSLIAGVHFLGVVFVQVGSSVGCVNPKPNPNPNQVTKQPSNQPTD